MATEPTPSRQQMTNAELRVQLEQLHERYEALQASRKTASVSTLSTICAEIRMVLALERQLDAALTTRLQQQQKQARGHHHEFEGSP
jgi:hypothetical protein